MMNLVVILLILLLSIRSESIVKPVRSATSGHSDPKVPFISSFLAGGQYILLTFSNGPHTHLSSQILDILSNHTIHATFFVYGEKAVENEEILRRIVSEGHELGHQGYYSGFLKRNMLDQHWLNQTLNATSHRLSSVVGKKVEYFRTFSPYKEEIGKLAHRVAGVKTILWSIDVSDKLGRHPSLYGNPVEISNYIVSEAKPGAIILAHDTHPLWLEILPALLPALTKQGYEFVTVSQMMSFPDDAPH